MVVIWFGFQPDLGLLLKAIDRIALIDAAEALKLLQPSTAVTLLNNEFTALFDKADEREAVERFDCLKSVASVLDGNEAEIDAILQDSTSELRDIVKRCA